MTLILLIPLAVFGVITYSALEYIGMKSLRRLYLLITCKHNNTRLILKLEDDEDNAEIQFCYICGLLVGYKDNNRSEEL